jgi:hypothetical protein
MWDLKRIYLTTITEYDLFFDITTLSISNFNSAIAEFDDPSMIKENLASNCRFSIGIPSLCLGYVEISYSLRDVKQISLTPSLGHIA